MTAVAKDTELVAPDSCAIMEGEDAEDELLFTTRKSLFSKIKSLTSRRTSEYIYPDSSVVFEFFVQNDQCQSRVEESRWMRTTEKGWEFHSCNPGYATRNGSACLPCPLGSYSKGSGCLSCPEGTEPVLGLEYKWWNVLPPHMETTVLSGINLEYKGMAGWEVAGDYIYTAAGASDNDFMILTLVVPGFSPPSPVPEDTESKEVARITFIFETICSVSCELYFMVGVKSRTNTPVETWTGPQGKQSYTYVVQKNATTSFTWAFQRTPYREEGRRYTNDMAKLYSVNVTNVLGGGASFCRRCVPEPAGATCSNNASLALALRGHLLSYEFPALGSGRAVATAGGFSSKGRPYRHLYSLRLCGHQGRKMATCRDNVTGQDRDTARLVTSYVCQAILIPADVMGYRTAVTSQPVSLADRLLAASGDPLGATLGKCPEGTCDGCTFHFLWVTGEGCPRCSATHYRPIVSACVGGIQ
ncbi:PREDICTED: UPF0577 protein KIAA1324-like, partial [Chaetura pelagica]|uniref:UPF0577 protein KIAA1324-like n=1 Tax=Chaetura pelagica TaxID=8897 RepID=UPI000523D640